MTPLDINLNQSNLHCGPEGWLGVLRGVSRGQEPLIGPHIHHPLIPYLIPDSRLLTRVSTGITEQTEERERQRENERKRERERKAKERLHAPLTRNHISCIVISNAYSCSRYAQCFYIIKNTPLLEDTPTTQNYNIQPTQFLLQAPDTQQ